jgi:uncharacterized protein YbcI
MHEDGGVPRGGAGVGVDATDTVGLMRPCSDPSERPSGSGRRRPERQPLSELRALSGGELNAALTREVVRIHATNTGRGPTKSFSFYNGTIVVTVMQEVMTRAEQRLAANGESEAVLRMRQLFQRTMGPELRASVEQLTGRKVVAFMSDSHVEPDMAVEVFVLDEPLG